MIGNRKRYEMRTFDLGNLDDIAEARKVLEKDDSPKAHATLGIMLFNTDDRRLQKEAIPHLQIAANAGDAIAIGELGDAYFKGIGVRKDVSRGLDCYLDSALGGCTESMFSIGNEYLLGKNVRADYAKAFEFLSMAAERGSDRAMNSLGLMYMCGLHVDQNLKTARRWFQKALSHGNESARSNIEMMRELGDDYDYRSNFLSAYGP